MKYIVEVTTSNPSHEHVSLRRVQKKTNFVVEASSEAEALMRARGKFRSLGHYVHGVQLVEQQVNERISLGAPASDQLKAKEKVAKGMEDKPEEKTDTALARINKDIETSEYAKQNPEYAARQKAFKDEYLKKKKAAKADKTELNVKEEIEYIEEKLTAADPASKWIADFVASDNPKFKGKSKKERIRMALGAHYAAKRANEEVSLEEQERPVANPNAVPKKSKEPKEPGTTDYSKDIDPAVPAKHPLEAERAKVEAEVRKRQAELAKQAAEKKKTNEEVEQMEEGKGYSPGWMLKKDKDLGAKVKEKINLAKKRQASYGKPEAGVSVKKEEVVAEAKGEPPPEFMPSDTKLPRIKVPAKPKPGVRKRGPVGSFNKKGFWNPGVRNEEVEISESSGDAPINKMTHADLADYVNKSAKWVENNREEAEKMAHEMTMDMSEEAINELLIGKTIKAVAKKIDDKIVGGRMEPPIKPPSKPPVASGAADAPKPVPAAQPLPTDKPVKDMSADEYKQYYDRRAITRRALEKAQRSAPPSGVSVKASQNPYSKLANEQKTLMTYEKNPPAEKVSSSETTMDTETKRSDAEAQKKTKAAAAAEKLVKAIKNKINVKPEMSTSPEQKEVK